MSSIPKGLSFAEEDYKGEKIIVICYNAKILEPVWNGKTFKGYRRKK